MSLAEKRYFKRFAARHALHGKNKYLELFDRIERSAPDASNFEQLSALRSYLQKMILRALHNFHYQGSVGMELRSYLDYIELLAARGLLKTSRKLIAKGLKKARAAGSPAMELAFLRWSRKLSRALPATRQDVDALDTAEQAASDALQQETVLLRQYHHLFLRLQQQHRGPDVAAYGDLPGLKMPAPDSFDGALAYHTTLGILAQLRGDHSEMWRQFRANLDVWYHYPVHITQLYDRFSAAIQNYLGACHEVGRYDAFQETLARIDADRSISEARRKELLLKCHNLDLLHQMNTLRFDRAATAARQVQSEIEHYRTRPLLYISIAYNLGIYCFITDQHSNCRRWLNRILDLPVRTVRKDLQQIARLLEVLLQYDAGAMELVLSRLRALERGGRRQTLPAWGWTLVRMMKRLVAEVEANKADALLRQAIAELDEVPASDRGNGYREVRVWMESKRAKGTVQAAWEAAQA